MIFVTVGGQNFLRLIKEMDTIAARTDEKIVMQIGQSEYTPQNAEYFRFAPKEDYLKLCNEARIIVCHDGAGSIMLAFQLNKPMIVVPRTPQSAERERNENDLVIELEERRVIKVVWKVEDMESAIRDIDEGGLLAIESSRSGLIHKLREHVNSTKHGRRQ